MNKFKKQTILYVSDYYPPYTVGGAEVSTSYIVDIASREYRTLILTGRFRNKEWKQNESVVFPKMVNVRINNESLFNKVIYLVSSIYAPFLNSFNLLKLMRKEKVDLIHLIPSSYHTIPLAIASLLTGKPVIIDIRNYSLLCPVSRMAGKCNYHYGIKCFDCLMRSYHIESKFLVIFKPVIALYELFLFNFYTFFLRQIIKINNKSVFVANSNYVRNELVKDSFPLAKIRVVYNIANFQELSKENRQNKIIFVGSLERAKGVWDAIRGFELSGQAKFELDIVGEGNEKRDIEDYIKSRKLYNIKLVGRISHEAVIKLYSKSKIILAPSVWNEPFGRFILESMSTGTPIIATETGGTPEGIINMQTGILVEPESPKQIASAINRLINDSKLYGVIQKNLNEKIKEYSTEKIGKERMDLYEEFLKI